MPPPVSPDPQDVVKQSNFKSLNCQKHQDRPDIDMYVMVCLLPRHLHFVIGQFQTIHYTHLSSGARKRSGVLGGARCPPLPDWRPLCQAERLVAVPGVVPEGPPRAPVVPGALQHHGSRPGGAEHQDEMGEEELGLQVQPERLPLRPPGRLPPGVRVAERAVAHGRRRVRLAGDGGVALAALGRRAGLSPAGRSALLVETIVLGGVGAAHRPGAQHSAPGQVAHAGVAGSARAAAARGRTLASRRVWREKCYRMIIFVQVKQIFVFLLSGHGTGDFRLVRKGCGFGSRSPNPPSCLVSR